jgi:predicted AlkP superfamily pyrophosphatase or phosphodiesterase
MKTNTLNNQKTLSLFVFVDAFGWELYQKYGFMKNKLKEQKPLGTVLGYSATCVPTILTGKKPQEHEHFSFYYYAPEKSPFNFMSLFKYLPGFLFDRARVRNLISKYMKKLFGYTGYFQIYNAPFKYLPLFNYSEKQDLYMGGGINSGDITIFDYLDKQGINFHLSDWEASEQDNLEALKTSIANDHIDFAYLYLPAMDGLLHMHGTDSKVIENKIKWYEEQLVLIQEYASDYYQDIRLHVFSDHGMKNVVESHDLMTAIEKLGLTYGKDYVGIYDSTMARFWFHNDKAKDKITELLSLQNYGKILSEDDLENYGCNFKNDLYGELIFLLDAGKIICPSFMGKKPVAGMHGYAPEDPDSTAFYVSTVSSDLSPVDLTDMYALMLNEAMIANQNNNPLAEAA